MKNFIITFCFFLLSFSGFCQDITWQDSLHYDFGDLRQNVPARHDFVFCNHTNTNLEIDVVRTTCSCTDSEWTMAPIPPGGEGHIIAIYDSRLKGYFNKKIKVFFKKRKGSTTLKIAGYVE
jgi:hypothetical protein